MAAKKQFWRYNNQISNIVTINGKTDDFDKATEINNFFTNVAANLVSTVTPVYNPLVDFPASCPVVEFHSTSSYEPSSSCGIAGLTADWVEFNVP